MKIEHAGETHVGLVRARNEDANLMVPEENLFVVADGMGGHRAGDVASRTAVDSISHFFRITASGSPAMWPHIAAGFSDPHARRLVSAIQYAHQCLVRADHDGAEGAGTMGTTIVALHFAGSLAFLAHAGDCRCYCYCQDNLRQLTRDHTMVADIRRRYELTPQEEERINSYRHVVTRALSTDNHAPVDVDIRVMVPRPGDLFLLCSDGLHSEILDRDIADALKDSGPLQDVCQGLVAAAIERGGRDNITAMLVRYVEGEPPSCIPIEAEDTQEIARDEPLLDVLEDE